MNLHWTPFEQIAPCFILIHMQAIKTYAWLLCQLQKNMIAKLNTIRNLKVSVNNDLGWWASKNVLYMQMHDFFSSTTSSLFLSKRSFGSVNVIKLWCSCCCAAEKHQQHQMWLDLNHSCHLCRMFFLSTYIFSFFVHP